MSVRQIRRFSAGRNVPPGRPPRCRPAPRVGATLRGEADSPAAALREEEYLREYFQHLASLGRLAERRSDTERSVVGHQHAGSISQRPCRAARELRRADRRVFRNGDGTSEQHGLVVGQDRKREAHRGGGGRVDGMGMDDGAYVTAREVDLPVELFFNRGAAFALKHGSAWRQLRQISGRERRVIPLGVIMSPSSQRTLKLPPVPCTRPFSSIRRAVSMISFLISRSVIAYPR